VKRLVVPVFVAKLRQKQLAGAARNATHRTAEPESHACMHRGMVPVHSCVAVTSNLEQRPTASDTCH
jgi:hypothetical protein